MISNVYRIHDLSNRLGMSDVTTPVPFPDINPADRPDNFNFQMVPGDFEEVVQNQVTSSSELFYSFSGLKAKILT